MGSTELTYREFFESLAEESKPVEPGLSHSEFREIESRLGFVFPPDLREFLSIGLPVYGDWVDWRSGDRREIQEKLAWPLEGMCFDIEYNGYWRDNWGPKPLALADQFEIARKAVASAPTLIPIYSHRYIPDRPSEEGNPVFSVYQTDIIYYGHNLKSYLLNEFWKHILVADDEDVAYKHIEFWSDVIEDYRR